MVKNGAQIYLHKKDDILLCVPFWLENKVHCGRNDIVTAYYGGIIVFDIINHYRNG